MLLNTLRTLGFDQLDAKNTISADSLKEILTNPPHEINLLYRQRGRLWKDYCIEPPRKEPNNVKSHLAAINAILKAQYGAAIKSTNGHKCTSYGIVQTAWPDKLMSGKWNDPLPEKKPLHTKLPSPPAIDTPLVLEAGQVDYTNVLNDL